VRQRTKAISVEQVPAWVRLRLLTPAGVGRLRWRLRVAQQLRSLVRNRPHEIGRTEVVRLARRGFLPASYELYGVSRAELAEYVSDRQRELAWALNWPVAGFLDDKLASFFMLRHLGARTPAVQGLIVAGELHSLADRRPDPRFEWVRQRIAKRPLVVKPVSGARGRDVIFLGQNESACTLNGVETAWEAIRERLSRLAYSLVTDVVESAAYARRIFGGSVNTIRVLTMRSVDGGEPFVVSAVHRFGRPASVPTDNWSRGGISAAVDLETGTLGPAASSGKFDERTWYPRHPDTNEPIEGVRVAGWPQVRSEVLALAGRTSFLPYVGWDVIVTDEGPVILEGNKNPDIDILQVHEPMFRDPRVRAFFEAHGIS
jgi:hypothetical protein